MLDTSGHVATRRDDLHTLTLTQLEAKIIEAGIVMSRRQIMRHCKAGTFDAQKLPATNNVEEWFIAPGSVEKGIADIKTLQALRSRRDTTRRDMSDSDEPENARRMDTDMSSHVATRHDKSDNDNQGRRGETQLVTTGYVDQLEKRIEEKDEVIGILRGELSQRNDELVRRNERERETNVLIRGLQNLVLQLQAPSAPRAPRSEVLDSEPIVGETSRPRVDNPTSPNSA